MSLAVVAIETTSLVVSFRADTDSRRQVERKAPDLGAAARVYGHAHVAVHTREQLRSALEAALGQPGLRVIEVIVPPHDAGPRQRAIYAQVDAMLRQRQEASA